MKQMKPMKQVKPMVLMELFSCGCAGAAAEPPMLSWRC
jgi:hypothetical protein